MPTKKVGFLIKQVHILQEQKLNKKFDRFDLTGAQMFTIINLFKAREKGERLTQRDLERILDISNPCRVNMMHVVNTLKLQTKHQA